MDINCTDRELLFIKKVARAAKNLGLETYLIGGFVRDKLLGRETKDADFVCVGDAIELANETAKQFHPTPQVDFFKNFGTAHIRLTDGFDIEFVGARKESYQRNSRKPEVEPGTVKDDQDRRDFTINAMAISLNEADLPAGKAGYGKLIDPFNGLADLENRIIRTPLEPAQTFSDDPLRMMRGIRFASQLGFRIEQKTWQGIIDSAERISIISQERITDELNKIIASPRPSVGFGLLYESGLLKLIFPQMVELAGAENKDGIGHKDNFWHTLQVLDNISVNTEDLWLRWAAILHDIGKPPTKKFEEGHGWTFHGHEVVGGRMVPKIFTKLKLPQNEKMRFVRKLVELHLRPISLTKENITDSAIRRLLFDAGEDLEPLMLLCEADITSKNRQKVKRYLENFKLVRQRCKEVEESDHIRTWQPPVTGELIMETFGLAPSKPVGIIKDALKDAMLDGLIPNTYEAAYDFMLEKGRSMGLTPVNLQS
ncbi:MAG TPA: HD domain-containing protein [Chitinophagaceae bacterium]|jgi:putative nucleotidyltransferase with HDIG domain|nr:HD domain-containing protein [Chitinophagaceae bacterium]